MKAYYQPRGGKKGQYALRNNTYRRIWYLIADYKYFKQLEVLQRARVAEAEIQYSEEKSKPTEVMQEHRQQPEYMRYICAIEKAQKEIPEEYVEDVMSHIADRRKYRDMEGVSEKTIKIWVQRFIWYVAKNLGDI